MKKLRINFDSDKEKRTFYLHLFYSILDGIILGVLALNEFVLIKGLKGSPYQIAVLFQFTIIVLLASVPLNEILKRTARKRKMLRYIAIITRAPLLLLLFFPKSINGHIEQIWYQFIFLGIFLIYYSANPVIFPTINGFLKTNYKHKNFSKYFGYASFANKTAMLIATFSFGLLLDLQPYAYTYVYPFLAFIGIFSIIILTKIDYNPPVINKGKKILHSLKDIKQNLKKIIKTNKPFRDFEIGFMFYGFAWLVTVAVIVIFLENYLKLSYSGIAFYKNFYSTVSIILTPVFGKLLGKINPRKFAIYAFSTMLLFIFFMGLTQFIPLYTYVFGIKIYYTLIISYMFYGIFGAMMGLLWYIGSAYFSKDEDAPDYQSLHLSLTGFRGAFAPVVGIFFYSIIDYSGVFALGVISLFIGIIFLKISLKRHK